jgi:predicted nucleotidyltransferase
MDSQTPVIISIPGLSEPVVKALSNLVKKTIETFGQDLRSVVLFGSGAEGRLRPTSDVNLLFIVDRFSKDLVDPIREALQTAQAAAKAQVMFIRRVELENAAETFALKFADIARRHKILYGEDLVAGLTPSRKAIINALKQALLNMTIRFRGRYASVSLQEEQITMVIAEATGPLRAAAASLLALEGHHAASPKEALATVVQSLEWAGGHDLLRSISEAREKGTLPAGVAPALLFQMIDLAEALYRRGERVESHGL